MTGKELKKFVNAIPPEFDNAEVVVDTEARCFECHIVDVNHISMQPALEDFGLHNTIIIHPDTSYTVFTRSE